MAKICCGGFNIGDGLELDGKTLKATGGGAGGVMVNFTLNTQTASIVADKTPAEVLELSSTNCVYGKMSALDNPENTISLGLFMTILIPESRGLYYDYAVGFIPRIGGDGNGIFMVGVNDDGDGWVFTPA